MSDPATGQIREDTFEGIQGSEEAEGSRLRHAQVLLALAEEAEPELEGPKQVEWLGRLDAEHDSMMAVLAWSTSQSKEPSGFGLEEGLRLASALEPFWERRDHLTEGRTWLEALLSRAETDASTGGGPQG